MTVPSLSIVTATFNSLPWIELFIKSIRRFTTAHYEIIVIDNGSGPESIAWLKVQKDIQLWISDVDFDSPGAAMDRGTELAQAELICFLDSDSHIQRSGWEVDIAQLYGRNSKTRLLCKAGPMNIGRPIHPPIFFYEKSFFLQHGLSFRYQKGIEGSTDTAQKTYWDILKLGYSVERVNRGKPFYGPNVRRGDYAAEIWINDKPTIYHHNYGSRLRLCGDNKWKWECYYDIPAERKAIHESRTAALFEEPLVKEILAGN